VDRGELGYGQGIGVILTPKLGGFVEYDVDVLTSANYQVKLRYASAAARPLRLSVDGKVISDHAANGETGGFDPNHQNWENTAVVSLTRGRHVLRLDTDGVFPHLDALRLESTDRVTKS
jgi:hypothetical protein